MKKYAMPISSLMIMGVILSGCGNNSNEPAKINESNHQKQEQKTKDSSKEQKANNNQDRDKNKDQQSKDEDTKNKKTTTTLDDAINEADRLHDFIVYDSMFTNNLKRDLKNQGINLEGEYYSPYTDLAKAPDKEQTYIFAGIIDDKKVEKKKDSAIITYKVKSGMSSTQSSNGEIADSEVVGKAIQDKLKNDKKYKNKVATVKYEVKMNKDKTATIKKLTKGDWSRV